MISNNCSCAQLGQYSEDEYKIFIKVLGRSVLLYTCDNKGLLLFTPKFYVLISTNSILYVVSLKPFTLAIAVIFVTLRLRVDSTRIKEFYNLKKSDYESILCKEISFE